MGDDGAGKPACRELAQHELARAAVGLERVRQREALGHELLVQHRHTDLDARPHAHHVDFAEHVRRQTHREERLGQASRQLLQVGHAGRLMAVEVAVHGEQPFPGGGED